MKKIYKYKHEYRTTIFRCCIDQPIPKDFDPTKWAVIFNQASEYSTSNEYTFVLKSSSMDWHLFYVPELKGWGYWCLVDLNDVFDLVKPNYSKIWRNICETQI